MEAPEKVPDGQKTLDEFARFWRPRAHLSLVKAMAGVFGLNTVAKCDT